MSHSGVYIFDCADITLGLCANIYYMMRTAEDQDKITLLVVMAR